jgi:hypothetical protein
MQTPVEADMERKVCLKCGTESLVRPGPLAACAQCGAIFERVEAAREKAALAADRKKRSFLAETFLGRRPILTGTVLGLVLAPILIGYETWRDNRALTAAVQVARPAPRVRPAPVATFENSTFLGHYSLQRQRTDWDLKHGADQGLHNYSWAVADPSRAHLAPRACRSPPPRMNQFSFALA